MRIASTTNHPSHPKCQLLPVACPPASHKNQTTTIILIKSQQHVLGALATSTTPQLSRAVSRDSVDQHHSPRACWSPLTLFQLVSVPTYQSIPAKLTGQSRTAAWMLSWLDRLFSFRCKHAVDSSIIHWMVGRRPIVVLSICAS